MVFRRNTADQVADSLDEFHKTRDGIGARLHLLDNSLSAYARERARLLALDENRRQRNNLHKLDKKLASDTDEYATFIDRSNRNLDRTWKKLGASFDKFLASMSPKRQRDVDAIRLLLKPAKDEQLAMETLVSSMSDLRSTMSELDYKNKSLGKSLRRFDKSQRELIDRLRVGDSVLSKFIADAADFLLK